MGQPEALLVGINWGASYTRDGCELAGCIPDMDNWAAYLDSIGWPASQIADNDNATAATIKAALDRMHDANPGDVRFFMQSSHGTIVTAPDGRVLHSLCPVDFDFDKPETWLTADDLADWIAGFREGVRVFTCFDACLDPLYGAQAERDKRADVRGFLRGVKNRLWPGTPNTHATVDRTFRQVLQDADLPLAGIDACGPDQYAADTPNGGAMSCALLRRLQQGALELPASGLVREICISLEADGFDQRPTAHGRMKDDGVYLVG